MRLPARPVFDDGSPASARLNEAIRRTPGAVAFCCRHIPDAIDHAAGGFGRQPLKPILQLLLADIFMWNWDRSVTTPNLLWSAQGMVPIDHGRAFYGIELIDESGCPRFSSDDPLTDRWAEHLAFGWLAAQAGRRRFCLDDVEKIANELAAVAAQALPLAMGQWPDGLGPSAFLKDLQDFLERRRRSLHTLFALVYDGLAAG